MIKPEEVQNFLKQKMPDAEITVQDLTGTMDHFEIMVMWSGFKGKNLIAQHKDVNDALTVPLEDGRIHAIKIKTFVPEG